MIPRAAEKPGSMFQATISPGEAEIDIGSGTNINEDTDALLAGLAFEGVGNQFGGGVQLDVYVSDDDLLEETPAADTSVTGVTLFPHFTYRPGSDRFRAPIRVGPEAIVHTLEVAGAGGSSDFDWVSIGLGLQVEPEYDFFRDEKSALSIYGQLRGGFGIVAISGPTDDFDSDSQTFGVEIGMRYQIARFLAAVGYMSRTTNYAESDVVNSTIVEETDYDFRGFFVTLGSRW
ncbi:MAG TPA: hypothetical protein VF384_15070 [Planctomycetota bacterium]